MKRIMGAIGAVVGVTLVTAFATPQAFAGSAFAVNSAIRLARGAAVSVSVTVTCDPYTDWTGQPSSAVDVNIAFRQAVRHGIITTGSVDSGWLNICDSAAHSLRLQIEPSPYAAVKGAAIVDGVVSFNTFGGLPGPQNYTAVVKVG